MRLLFLGIHTIIDIEMKWSLNGRDLVDVVSTIISSFDIRQIIPQYPTGYFVNVNFHDHFKKANIIGVGGERNVIND